MDLIREASPFLFTAYSELAMKELYSKPFDVIHIGNPNGERPIKNYGFSESDVAFEKRNKSWEDKEKNVLFDGWVCKDMGHFQVFSREYDDAELFFEYSTYTISVAKKLFEFPLHPETIDDLICDCRRVGVKLFWKQNVIDKYSLSSVTSQKKTIEYYRIIRENMNE